MAHWAELDEENRVLRVIVAAADDGADGALHPPVWFADAYGGTWKRTYYSTPGHTYAGIGFTWDPAAENFVPPPPFPSWVFDKDTLRWEPPISYPDGVVGALWDEAEQSWAVTSLT